MKTQAVIAKLALANKENDSFKFEVHVNGKYLLHCFSFYIKDLILLSRALGADFVLESKNERFKLENRDNIKEILKHVFEDGPVDSKELERNPIDCGRRL